MLRKILLTIISWIARGYMRLAGWRIVGDFSDLQKAVIVGAPHTSGFDLLYSMLTAFSCKVRLRWVGKKTYFEGYKGPFARLLGGIPVDRSGGLNSVEQIAAYFEKNDHFMLAISPEGTRKKVGHWRSGFYYIAHRAGVPFVIARMDYQEKEVTISQLMVPTGDIHADFQLVREFYEGTVGKNAEKFGEIRLADDPLVAPE